MIDDSLESLERSLSRMVARYRIAMALAVAAVVVWLAIAFVFSFGLHAPITSIEPIGYPVEEWA